MISNEMMEERLACALNCSETGSNKKSEDRDNNLLSRGYKHKNDVPQKATPKHLAGYKSEAQ